MTGYPEFDPTFLPYLGRLLRGRPRPLWQEDVAARRADVRKKRVSEFGAAPDDIKIDEIEETKKGKHTRVRVYRPKDAIPAAAIIYIHGGGWVYGSPDQSDHVALRIARSIPAVVFCPYYRLAPEHRYPDAFNDCCDAYLWVRENIEKFCGRAVPLGVFGDSAGGNLAVSVSAFIRTEHDIETKILVLNYPALGVDFDTESYNSNWNAPILSGDEMKYFWTSYLGDIESHREDPFAVPLSHKDYSIFPTTILNTAEFDPLRDDGLRFAQSLIRAGVRVHAWNARRLPHGFLRAWGESDDVTDIGAYTLSMLKHELTST